MPERARETGTDKGERSVRLFCENRKSLWLCTEDADWALVYLKDQLITKGVRQVALENRGPGARPAAAVASGTPAVCDSGAESLIDADCLTDKFVNPAGVTGAAVVAALAPLLRMTPLLRGG